RDRSRTPLFQVSFNYLNRREGMVGVDEVRSRAGISRFDLSVVLGEVGDGLAGVVEYSTALFDDERMARLVGHFRELLAGVAEDAERHLSRLELLTEAERGRLAQWNATDVPVPPGGVHELFEAQVAAEPGRTAVVCGAVSLTYEEVDVRANRLA